MADLTLTPPVRRALTGAERAILIRDLDAGPSPAHHRSATRRLAQPIDEASLAAGHAALLGLHPTLGCLVRRYGAEWYFTEPPYPSLPHVEQLRLDHDGTLARRRAADEARRPIDPVAGPLVRVTLLRFAHDGADLVVRLHRLAVEVASPQSILRALARAAEASH